MTVKDIPLPEEYKTSEDFRFFLKWFELALSRIQSDTENFFDYYDPLRCPTDFIWALADTMSYQYDPRLPASFNRLVLIYFMSMIYNRGSREGVRLAAQVNLAQFKIQMLANGYTDENDVSHPPKEILNERLEDTSIPVNSVFITPFTEKGYIEVVYKATRLPLDACIEYVRPLGMFLFQHAGVVFNARTKITVDARLTDERDIGSKSGIGITRVGHYRREDYARIQKQLDPAAEGRIMRNDPNHTRNLAWYRNPTYEDYTAGGEYESGAKIDAGYRTLYSLQLCNNEEVVKALIDPIFSIGYDPQETPVEVEVVGEPPDRVIPPWNLRYDRLTEENLKRRTTGMPEIGLAELPAEPPHIGVYMDERGRKGEDMNTLQPKPAVNVVMSTLGDAIVTGRDEDRSLTFIDFPNGNPNPPPNT